MLAVATFLNTNSELNEKLFVLEETVALLAVSSPEVPLISNGESGFDGSDRS